MSEVELAWAAGFFEGEGCVYLAPGNLRPYLRIHIGQVDDRLPLDRFVEAVGAGRVRGPHMMKGKRRKYGVGICTESHEIMEKLRPYLGEQSKKIRVYLDALEAGARPKGIPPAERAL